MSTIKQLTLFNSEVIKDSKMTKKTSKNPINIDLININYC